MSFKIFVSYSTKDLTQVELLKNQLVGTNIEVFIAEHSILASQELAPTISKAIMECDLFVVLWSNNAKNSDWVSQEIGRADTLNKTILPLVLDDDLNLPGFISRLKYIPVYKDENSSLSQARKIIVKAYESKKEQQKVAQVKKKKDSDTLVLMGIGAFLLWANSK